MSQSFPLFLIPQFVHPFLDLGVPRRLPRINMEIPSQSYVERKSVKLPNGTIFNSTTWHVAPEVKEKNLKAKSAASKSKNGMNTDDIPESVLDNLMGQMTEQLATANVLMSKFKVEFCKSTNSGSEAGADQDAGKEPSIPSFWRARIAGRQRNRRHAKSRT